MSTDTTAVDMSDRYFVIECPDYVMLTRASGPILDAEPVAAIPCPMRCENPPPLHPVREIDRDEYEALDEEVPTCPK